MLFLPSFTRLCPRPHFLRVGHSVSLGLRQSSFVGLRRGIVGLRHVFSPVLFYVASLWWNQPYEMNDDVRMAHSNLSYALHIVVRTFVHNHQCVFHLW
jgi:hypothetical protein